MIKLNFWCVVISILFIVLSFMLIFSGIDSDYLTLVNAGGFFLLSGTLGILTQFYIHNNKKK